MKEREIELETRDPFFAASKIRIGPKALSITTKDGARFSFQKGILADRRDGLTIMVEVQRTIKIPKKCDLGHMHEAPVKTESEFAWLSLTWEEAQSLNDWFQTGSWSEVRARRKAAPLGPT